jgi:hypothetical protein
MQALGREADGPARVYFTGGATAVLLGWRGATIDVDVKIVPEQDALLRGLASLKDVLSINVELAAPDDFIPVEEGWDARSPFIASEGPLSFFHFDLIAQALAKLERSHAQDLDDVRAMRERGLVDPARLRRAFEAIRPRLYKYPAVDPASFERAVNDFSQK